MRPPRPSRIAAHAGGGPAATSSAGGCGDPARIAPASVGEALDRRAGRRHGGWMRWRMRRGWSRPATAWHRSPTGAATRAPHDRTSSPATPTSWRGRAGGSRRPKGRGTASPAVAAAAGPRPSRPTARGRRTGWRPASWPSSSARRRRTSSRSGKPPTSCAAGAPPAAAGTAGAPRAADVLRGTDRVSPDRTGRTGPGPLRGVRLSAVPLGRKAGGGQRPAKAGTAGRPGSCGRGSWAPPTAPSSRRRSAEPRGRRPRSGSSQPLHRRRSPPRTSRRRIRPARSRSTSWSSRRTRGGRGRGSCRRTGRLRRP